jgi:hypothetical protein
VIGSVRQLGIALGSLVIAALTMLLVGAWIPQVLGAATVPIATVILGGLIFRDISTRDRRRRQPQQGGSV